ncbi:conserved hypothetical protein [Desulfamplus magnetovallimortis]|uniref:Uncharacterized protein n=1 Tax=Desulfamplus magnetovallimortis TaxID=1246637 RepID=A0A1W1HC27_9BACT|nr:hypothetical protein [Desulfamplus magnetovallimortis]SLM30044.1 conserved hypothetical protein [Desulfamplus magnetovallimortis]
MGQKKIEPLSIQKLGENLALFAINRDDLKQLMATIPEGDETINLTTLEYELQILKILSVGWGLAFYMPESEKKQQASQIFWENIRDISKNISTLTANTTGKQIDYFNILKNRLDDYLKIMQENSQGVTDPSQIIGPSFAEACHCPDNAIAILVGTKMMTLTLGAVKEYLDAVEII